MSFSLVTWTTQRSSVSNSSLIKPLILSWSPLPSRRLLESKSSSCHSKISAPTLTLTSSLLLLELKPQMQLMLSWNSNHQRAWSNQLTASHSTANQTSWRSMQSRCPSLLYRSKSILIFSWTRKKLTKDSWNIHSISCLLLDWRTLKYFSVSS